MSCLDMCISTHCDRYSRQATEACCEDCFNDILEDRGRTSTMVFCSDCSSFLIKIMNEKKVGMCDHIACRSRIMGWPETAMDARSITGKCGERALYFSANTKLTV